LDELRDGHQWRDREEWTRLAWTCANLMNATGRYKRAVRMQDLLPSHFRGAPLSIEEVQRELAEKQKRFEAAAARRKKFKIADPDKNRSNVQGSKVQAQIRKRSKARH
jgi:hypothetical protein